MQPGEYLGEEASKYKVPRMRGPGDTERPWRPEGLGWTASRQERWEIRPEGPDYMGPCGLWS